MTIEFDVLPNLYLFTVIDINKLFSTNETAFENPEFTYDPSLSLLSLKFSYSQDISSKPFKLVLTSSVDLDERLWATNSTDWEFQLSDSINFNSES